MHKSALGTLLLGGILLAGLGACGAAGGACAESAADPFAEYNENLPKLGGPLPALAAVTLDGQQVTTDSLHGRTILLNLWFFR